MDSEAQRPSLTLMPTMRSRLAVATSTAVSGSIRRSSSLSPTMMRLEKPKIPACEIWSRPVS